MEKDTDVAMKNLWFHMERDARSACELPMSYRRRAALASGDIKRYREYTNTHEFRSEDPYTLKWSLQLESLHKRYRFKNDAYSDDQLSAAASKKFLDDQLRISGPLNPDTMTLLVLKRARLIVSSILGDFSQEEHYERCQFSRHANLNVPFREAYLDRKIKIRSGTKDQHTWFRAYALPDDLLCRLITSSDCDLVLRNDCADSLSLAKVPKSFKAMRTMLPNTVLGSFYSHGLGEIIRMRLLNAGLDISRLQSRHKILAMKFSRSRSHVTADLTSASDSFNRELLRRLLPSRWYHSIVFGLPRSYKDDGELYSLQSVMTMGMGHTFPLQTLLFYAILRAVQSLTDVRGLISVYGDDLIYPRRLHDYVRVIFPKLNLQLGTDKTFVSTHFRESCGGDYFRGIDVRPFCYEGEHRRLSRRPYTAFLYKLYNGLLLRWDEHDIPQTLHYLMTEICNATNVVYQVPPSFPADAGIIVTRPKVPGLIPWAPVKFNNSLQCAEFRHLIQMSDHRIVECQRSYLWDVLRAKTFSKGLVLSPTRWICLPHKGKRLHFCVEDKKSSTKLRCTTAFCSRW